MFSRFDLLATPTRRKLLFASLYFSEGAPIGFLWLALPTQLRVDGVAIEDITWFTATLVLPWTLKFAWAPLVDLWRSERWTLRHWVLSAQGVMGLTLVPLLTLDLREQFPLIAACLFLHAFAASTQDVAIDALCISVTKPLERGRYNGWMQAGMLLGRAAMGGGALVLSQHLGWNAVVALLILCTTFSAAMVWQSVLPAAEPPAGDRNATRGRTMLRSLGEALRERNTWLGLAFAFTGGAAFKSLEVVVGPFLVDRDFTKGEIGWFTAGPMIGLMVLGSLAGGALADRTHRKLSVAKSLVWIVASVAALAALDVATEHAGPVSLLWVLACVAFGIGLFTAASYALFMDLTKPQLAATQFSAFMGATNGCEAWSVFVLGQIVAWRNYPSGMLAMCAASLLALLFLSALRIPDPTNAAAESSREAGSTADPLADATR